MVSFRSRREDDLWFNGRCGMVGEQEYLTVLKKLLVSVDNSKNGARLSLLMIGT